jgi:hypothetical protein
MWSLYGLIMALLHTSRTWHASLPWPDTGILSEECTPTYVTSRPGCLTFDVDIWRYLTLFDVIWRWLLTLTFDHDVWRCLWPWHLTLTFDIWCLILMLIFYMTDCHDIMTYDELSYVNLSYDSVTLGTMTYWHILLLNKLYTFHKLNTNLNG